MSHRILGVEIPDHKRGVVALTSIYGIGPTRATKILTHTKIGLDKPAKEWTDKEYTTIQRYIQEHYTVEGTLMADVQTNKKRKRDIGCYSGIRDRMGLPVRGQKTKNNARTRKGKRKTVAGKKKATKK